MPNALVTVLLPVFNGLPFLQAALMSIQEQTYHNMEILVIDDGSTDNSKEFLESAAERDSRIRLFSHDNRGLVPTLNQGLRVASGEFIARMDADDIAYPDRISRQLEIMQSDPELLLTGMNADYLFGRRKVISKPVRPSKSRSIRIENIFHAFFIHPTVMFNNKILTASKLLYDDRYRHCEDFDLWRRVSECYRVQLIAHTGLAWRQGHSSVRSRNSLDVIPNHFQIVSEQLCKNSISSDPSAILKFLQHDLRYEASKIAQSEHVLGEHLSEIWRFSKYYGSDRLAYEAGIRALISDLFIAAAKLNKLSSVQRAIRCAGLEHILPLKYKISNLLSKYVPEPFPEKMVDNMRTLGRVVRCRDIGRQASLPRNLLNTL